MLWFSWLLKDTNYKGTHILEAVKTLSAHRENDCRNRVCGSYTAQQRQHSMYVQSCFATIPKVLNQCKWTTKPCLWNHESQHRRCLFCWPHLQELLCGDKEGEKGGLSYTDAHLFHFLTQHMPVTVSWVLPSHRSHRICLGEMNYRCTVQGEKQVNTAIWSSLSWNILPWKLLLSNGLLCGTFRITAKNDLSNDFYNTYQRANPAFASFTVEVSWQQSQCWCFM